MSADCRIQGFKKRLLCGKAKRGVDFQIIATFDHGSFLRVDRSEQNRAEFPAAGYGFSVDAGRASLLRDNKTSTARRCMTDRSGQSLGPNWGAIRANPDLPLNSQLSLGNSRYRSPGKIFGASLDHRAGQAFGEINVKLLEQEIIKSRQIVLRDEKNACTFDTQSPMVQKASCPLGQHIVGQRLHPGLVNKHVQSSQAETVENT